MKHAKKTTEAIVPEPEQTIRLSETSGIMRRLAEAFLRSEERYLCVLNGVRTTVVRD